MDTHTNLTSRDTSIQRARQRDCYELRLAFEFLLLLDDDDDLCVVSEMEKIKTFPYSGRRMNDNNDNKYTATRILGTDR